jgi:phage tail P2-like protein
VSSLVPPNATPMERAFADVCVAMLAIDAPLATLANPDTIPAKFLPWLAWSLGVRTWKPYWSEAVKRSRVRHAIEIAKRQGTAQSVEDVVTSFGGHVELRPWFEQDPPGEPLRSRWRSVSPRMRTKAPPLPSWTTSSPK